MTSYKYKPGEVVLIPFPFSDLSGTKKRPALVLADVYDKQEIICMMLTSVQSRSGYEHSISCWKDAGLLKPTTARIHRIFTISDRMVYRNLGKLETEEYAVILKKVLNLISNGRC